MSIEVIQSRLNNYNCQTLQEEENALKEITQEIALLALARAEFFKVAAFHGGTSLRILHGLQRFSEDLDFTLQKPRENFEIGKYIVKIEQEFRIYGYQVEVQDKSSADSVVKKAFIKDDSLEKILQLSFPSNMPTPKKLKIKLELDTNPPVGAVFENRYHNFPLAFAVTAHDLPSGYAGKLHALLCRPYVKGRDWYDLLWYLRQRTAPNMKLLKNSLNQIGPWKDQLINIDAKWITNELSKKIRTLDWQVVRNDVLRFLKPHEQRAVEDWQESLFLEAISF